MYPVGEVNPGENEQPGGLQGAQITKLNLTGLPLFLLCPP